MNARREVIEVVRRSLPDARELENDDPQLVLIEHNGKRKLIDTGHIPTVFAARVQWYRDLIEELK